jgi:hypothetical protein
MAMRGRDLLMSVVFFRALEEEDSYRLMDSEVKIWTNIGDADYDNDDNPYIKIKTHWYSNIEGDEEPYEKDLVPMVACDHEYVSPEVKELWYPGKFYCPEWKEEHQLFTNYNYERHTWFRIALHYCDPVERATEGKSCATVEESEEYLDSHIYSLSYQ